MRVDLAAVGAEGEGLDVVVHLDGERLLLRPRVQEVHVTESTLLSKFTIFDHLVTLIPEYLSYSEHSEEHIFCIKGSFCPVSRSNKIR